MIGVPVERQLAMACEQRLGKVVHVATTINFQRVASPVGNFKARKALRLVAALSEDDLWLLDFRYWVIGFGVGAVLSSFPRAGLVSQWRHRWWAWPAVWKVELSWPELATYLTGSLIAGDDANRLMGLLAVDEFDSVRAMRAAADSEWLG